MLFDLGNVLIDWDPRRLYRKLLPDEAAVDRFLAEVCTGDWNVLQDAGRPFDEAVVELAGRFPEHAALITAYRDRWPEMLGGAIEPTVAVLDRLRRRPLRLCALTNWSAETWPHALARFDFLGWFEDIVVSGQVRLAKPDPRIFRLAIERCRLDPARTLFVDDSPRNVEAAAAAGFVSHRFTDAAALAGALAAAGVEV